MFATVFTFFIAYSCRNASLVMLIGAVRMALTVASLVELLGLVIGAAVLVLARGDAMGDGLNVGR
jgi:hypothetical protein